MSENTFYSYYRMVAKKKVGIRLSTGIEVQRDGKGGSEEM